MDLSGYDLDTGKIDAARRLSVEGLLTYQPFLFSPDFEVGVGYEFEQNRYAGLVYYPDIDPKLLESPSLRRIIVDPAHHAEFHAANRRLADYYDCLVEQVVDAVGGARGHSFLDVGCNAGYFPQAFALRGARVAAGCDRQDFSKTFSLINSITRANAQFLRAWYEPSRHSIEGLSKFDVVMSMAMLCHVADPLHLLSALAKLADKALFVWTLVNSDEQYTCHYGEPRQDYPSDAFPYCFDNKVCPSVPLLRRSLALLGFSQISQVREPPGHPSYTWQGYRFSGFIAVR
jgi:SAM-dependent methyltransferase